VDTMIDDAQLNLQRSENA